MGGICSTHGEINAYTILVGKTWREEHSVELDIDRRIILEWIVEK
jgi:hypothetical protein